MKMIEIKEERGYGVDFNIDAGAYFSFEVKDWDTPIKLVPTARRYAYQAIDEHLSDIIKECRQAQQLCRERALRAGKKKGARK